MLKCLLKNGNGVVSVESSTEKTLMIDFDRSKVLRDGKPALREMLLKLHIFRCTADVGSCRAYYEELSRVDGHYLEWRSIVIEAKQPKMVFVQSNTFFDGDKVVIREYEASNEGLIKSWFERDV